MSKYDGDIRAAWRILQWRRGELKHDELPDGWEDMSNLQIGAAIIAEETDAPKLLAQRDALLAALKDALACHGDDYSWGMAARRAIATAEEDLMP